jgi:hypothetical protein
VADYEDDHDIRDDETVLRRVPPQWIKNDVTTNDLIPSSGAFQDRKESGAMSVGLLSEIRARDLGPEVMLAGYGPAYGLVSLSVREVRALGQGVVRAPTDAEPWHALVFGPKPKKVQAALKLGCEWVVRPRE